MVQAVTTDGKRGSNLMAVPSRLLTIYGLHDRGSSSTRYVEPTAMNHGLTQNSQALLNPATQTIGSSSIQVNCSLPNCPSLNLMCAQC